MNKQESIDWLKVRTDFPAVNNSVYLNAAGMSPLSSVVRSAATEVLKLMSDAPKQFAESILPGQQLARESVAKLYNTDVSGIAFTHSTSLGMNMLALHFKNMAPSKKRIVTLDDEFPSSTLPWAHQGFDVHYVASEKDNTYSVDHILDTIDKDTAAVVVSYVQYNTGAKIEVHSLAQELKKRGVHFILNATQAAGIVPIDLQTLPVSAFLTSGNKWIMAGVGGSVMYLSESLRNERFPPFAGWVSADPISFDNRLGKIRKDGSSLELGLVSMIPIVCIKATVDYILDIGVEHIETRLGILTDYLIENLLNKGEEILTPLDKNCRAGIISIRRDSADELASRLKDENIIVISRGKDLLRISPHIYSNYDDLDYFLEKL